MSNTIFFLFTVLGFFLFANLMIAMFGSTYTKIEEESYTFWATNRAHLVISLINRPYIPPLNIVEVMFKMIGWVTSKCKPKNKSVDSRRRQVDRMLQRLPTRKRLHVKQLIEGNQSTMPPCLCHHAYATMPMPPCLCTCLCTCIWRCTHLQERTRTTLSSYQKSCSRRNSTDDTTKLLPYQRRRQRRRQHKCHYNISVIVT